jgi:hypothetical protein
VPPINPKPLSLSDAELDAVMRAAAQLHQMDRSAFLVAVAERLGFESTVGPGTIKRIIRELLKTRVYRLAEELAVGTGPSAWHVRAHHGYEPRAPKVVA